MVDRLAQKLHILSDAAKYDASCASSGARRSTPKGGIGNTTGSGICHSYTPDGRCVSLLKLLLTNYCVYDCLYCINRVSSDTPRARFTVAEVVQLTLDFYRRNYIEGLFLSSGIIQSPDYTMEQLAEVARTLREDHLFGGYIHLKAIPGASVELLDRAGRYADRLSANIELSRSDDLVRLAPAKTHDAIEGTMKRIHDGIASGPAPADRPASKNSRRRSRLYTPAGQSTQFVVGATPATDSSILQKAAALYTGYDLRRVYYSAFSPTPFAARGFTNVPAAPLIREHRLYQADWLLRYYSFTVDELTTPAEPNLSLDVDPKLAWALRNPAFFPVDINRRPRKDLLRVPGLGKRNVDRIIAARRFHSIATADLVRLGASFKKLGPFIIAADYRPSSRSLERLLATHSHSSSTQKREQLSLFDLTSAAGGEL